MTFLEQWREVIMILVFTAIITHFLVWMFKEKR